MKLIKNGIVTTAVLLAWVSCANMERDGRTAGNDLSLATYTPVTTQESAFDTLEKWEDRVVRLKKQSISTTNKDRHAKLEKQISRIEDKLEDARGHFQELKLASAEDKKKHLDKMNDDFNNVTTTYNNVLAE